MKEVIDGFTRAFLIRPAFDKRDADPKKNYGIHNVEMHWTLIGPLGAVTLMWHTTNLYLPSVEDTRPSSQMFEAVRHSPKPTSEWERKRDGSKNCAYTGGDCWSDGGFHCAEAAAAALIAEGEDGLFRELRVLYDAWFVEEVA